MSTEDLAQSAQQHTHSTAPNNDTPDHNAHLLDCLIRLAQARLSAAERPGFITFLPIYLAMAAPDSLHQRELDVLFQIVLEQWHLLQQRTPKQRIVHIRPPSADSPQFATVSTLIDDMPFLMDSVCMAIRDAGGAIDWAMHPILGISRDADGQLLEVLDPETGEQRESLIYIAFTPLLANSTVASPEESSAAYLQLQARIEQVLQDLDQAVGDYHAIKIQLHAVASALPASAEESRTFLNWLGENHFSLFAYHMSEVFDEDGERTLCAVPSASLGLMRAGSSFANSTQLLTPIADRQGQDHLNMPLITKASARSSIHRAQYLDVISLSCSDNRSMNDLGHTGLVTKVHHFIGLFASEVYSRRPREIPLIRRKVEHILARSQLREGSHSGKHLRNILHQLPRDELFQASEDELFVVTNGVRALRDRHTLRVFMRRDAFKRFYACLIYLPRDDYSRELRDQVCQQLMSIFQGSALERSVDFLRDGHALIHCIVHSSHHCPWPIDAIEKQLQSATRSWSAQLSDLLQKHSHQQHWSNAFPLSYQEHHSVSDALIDIDYLVQLSSTQSILPCLSVSADEDGKSCPRTLHLFAWQQPVALSDVLPTLENFGLRVIRQEPWEVKHPDGNSLWIQTFSIAVTVECLLAATQQKAYFEAAFRATWSGHAENDGHQRLVLGAGLNWRQIVCLRTLSKYLTQTGLPYSQGYMEKLLADNSTIAQLLIALFEARFAPDISTRQVQVSRIEQDLDRALDTLVTLDADRVLRAYSAVVRAALRTNFYQPDSAGLAKPWVSIKLDSRQIPNLPLPLPLVETFVYSPDIEGIHLRGGRVARGGLRWSDRREDFRTEVLGLMKAQMVKNAIIVPVGAKGGFVVKRGDPNQREAWQKHGIECYKTFIRALLDITDNRIGDTIVKPSAVICYDEDDPYLVVAADKGTASFSDIANGIADEYSFWLGDAFASGGSVGYDHKKMGITARGAWESVKRHFRELGKDIQRQAFTCIGIGDMSGDVFGNGLLLSQQTQLLAAFNHQHIFLDPTPDIQRSYDERQRLFALPRSGWSDYDTTLLSTGGGIYSRSAKSIRVSAEAQAAFALTRERYTPNELIKALLQAPVELLWNGGIGTYVKASHESHQDVGDRANEAVRINGRDLRCKVIGEGGNLGCTQLGRIEFARQGGHLNTDAIDNAGGVHCSDREVNIKIPLNQLMQSGQLTHAQRDPLLHAMSDELAHAVLDDNYRQSTSLSVQANHSVNMLDAHSGLMRSLEREGLLNRTVEFLPDEEQINERRKQAVGLTRPELAVLMSYSKISLFNALLASTVIDDSYFDQLLLSYFPPQLVARYPNQLLAHRLRREIIATQIANHSINHFGCVFMQRSHDELGFDRAELAKAFVLAYDMYQGERFWSALTALDNVIPSTTLDRLSERVTGLFRHVSVWLLTHPKPEVTSTLRCQQLRRDIDTLQALIPSCLPMDYRGQWQATVDDLHAAGTPTDTAKMIANTLVGGCLPDIVQLATDSGIALTEVASVYFWVGERIQISSLLNSVTLLRGDSKWPALARHSLRDDCYRLHQKLVGKILAFNGDTSDLRWQAWLATQSIKTHFALQRLDELTSLKATDFIALTVASRLLDQVAQG